MDTARIRAVNRTFRLIDFTPLTVDRSPPGKNRGTRLCWDTCSTQKKASVMVIKPQASPMPKPPGEPTIQKRKAPRPQIPISRITII